jgi:hypothetical protein
MGTRQPSGSGFDDFQIGACKGKSPVCISQERNMHMDKYAILVLLQDRTFTHIFHLKPKNFPKKSVNHHYQNPVYLAKEYRRLIDSGVAKSQTDLPLKLGVSKVHVCRVPSLLKLNDELIDAVEKIANPMPTRIVTERMLRECLKFPEMCKSILSRLSNFEQ